MPMQFEANTCYHIYNRGNNRQKVFHTHEHYVLFLKKFTTYCLPYCNVLAYCLMPNHFHFMIFTNDRVESEINELNNGIGTLLSSYTQALNKQKGWSGSIFQASTKAKELAVSENKYAQVCFHYIHQNPIKAQLVQGLGGWEYSSYQDYAGLRNGTLIDRNFTFRCLDISDDASFVANSLQALDPSVIDNIFE